MDILEQLLPALSRLLDPLKRRVSLMVSRCVLNLIDDKTVLQELQVSALANEVLDRVERLQEYGYTSVPHPGAEAVLLTVGGDRSHSLVIAVEDRRYRLKGLKGGEVAIYDDQGQKVHIKRGGIHALAKNILLESEGIIRLEGKGVEIHGREYVQEDVKGLGKRRSHTGGTNWHDDTYTTGANITGTEHGLDMPDIPSDHYERTS
ncbi:phage baseplate assembly protein V [uncultured Kiloniella sp.]|uniref:phage baseplate assembly protein V n=1 Tax=uncultured Kiloniella sp. TaxID=1133091 RepID=UPI0026160441|nr:phage baseplate assembly protein V [uncultured Kiloniella sp.]